MNPRFIRYTLLMAVLGLVHGVGVHAHRVETDLFERAPWTVSGGVGFLTVEGDQVLENGPFLGARLGYSKNMRVTFELGLDLAPSLDARVFDGPERRAVTGSAYLARLGPDVLLHLRNTENMRFDPYIGVGLGLYLSNKQFLSGKVEPYGSASVGLLYHFNNSWALRGEVRGVAVGSKSDFNLWNSIGLTYRFGAQPVPELRLVGGDLDSDGDGLADWLELLLETDPHNPDTDGDGLTDGEEHWVIFSDPLNADTDYDGLSDGDEVRRYETDPLNPDTDGGGVFDGHEVIEDQTNPLNPLDDLQLYTLNIEFDYDSAVLRTRYFEDLDVVVRVLLRDPGATARIEGHADRRPRSDTAYNVALSERRATAVLNYLADAGGIERSRMSAHGYGFSRPLAPNDTEENMQRNRRTEIYIRPSTPPEE
jgi:outer membrane protein OmpA-like peptidoglycan-associated protein